MELIRTEIAGSAPGPHLLITGGVHGDEFEPMLAIRRLQQRFAEADEQQSLRGRLTLIPVVNEPAFLNGARTAEDGLDLARVCPGRPDGSITEQVADALSAQIRSADYYIDLHTGGIVMSVLPMAGYCLHPDPQILDVQRRMAQAFNLPVIWGTSPNLEGRSLSIARAAGVPAIYTEHLGSGLCTPQGVQDYEEGCLNVMAELQMIDHPRPPSRVEHVVEDPRPSSGHMQIRHPSPVTGFWQPAVELGQAVSAGAPLGSVWDIRTGEEATIAADSTGIVLTLRTFSRVRENESVGVVIELQEPGA